jgi:CRP/FNR family transcriptional regulator, cyclic AMP receptor protein
MSQSLYDLIAEQPFFHGLNANHLQLLTESAMQMEFKADESIFQEGSPANRFYLILDGKVILESEQEGHGLVPIQTLGAGDDLGCSWLFAPYYFQLSARAIEPTRTIFFYGTRLREQCDQDHVFGYQLMKRIAEVLTQRLQTMQSLLMKSTEENGASSS